MSFSKLLLMNLPKERPLHLVTNCSTSW